jgi:hypothetical protein
MIINAALAGLGFGLVLEVLSQGVVVLYDPSCWLASTAFALLVNVLSERTGVDVRELNL